MPNDIPVRQNDDHFIGLLAAYSQAYDNAALWANLQRGLVLLTAAAVPVINAFVPAFQKWGAGISVVVLILDPTVLQRLIKESHTLAVMVQEMFDTELLGIPWNSFKIGDKPQPETVIGLTQRFRKRHAKRPEKIQKLHDWYPEAAGELPVELGRLVCQRSSMAWDANLRKLYCGIYVGLVLIIGLAGLSYGLWVDMKLSEFLIAVALPLLPALFKMLRSRGKHMESVSASERAEQSLRKTWQAAMAGNPSPDVQLTDARHLQDELLDRRLNSSRIPQWFYDWYRGDFEERMKAAAADMVKEAKAKI